MSCRRACETDDRRDDERQPGIHQHEVAEPDTDDEQRDANPGPAGDRAEPDGQQDPEEQSNKVPCGGEVFPATGWGTPVSPESPTLCFGKLTDALR